MKRLHQELAAIEAQIVSLSQAVGKATLDAVEALVKQDVAEAERIFESDQQINQDRMKIESDCVKTIATQQPTARDARYLASVLEVATELERMGDYAKDIASVAERIDGRNWDGRYVEQLRHLAKLATNMQEEALTAFCNEDADLAQQIATEDDKVDAACWKLHDELMRAIAAGATNVEDCQGLLTVTHDLERLADRVTNICERTVYAVTGEIVELDGPSRVGAQFTES